MCFTACSILHFLSQIHQPNRHSRLCTAPSLALIKESDCKHHLCKVWTRSCQGKLCLNLFRTSQDSSESLQGIQWYLIFRKTSLKFSSFDLLMALKYLRDTKHGKKKNKNQRALPMQCANVKTFKDMALGAAIEPSGRGRTRKMQKELYEKLKHSELPLTFTGQPLRAEHFYFCLSYSFFCLWSLCV